MDQESQLGQGEINKVWEGEWKRGGYTAKNLFGQRLFVEGYPVFRKYIPNNAKTILDVGGGTGRYGIRFAQDLPSTKVYITDILDESLVVARNIAKEVGVTNIVTQREDATGFTFPNEMFDVVFCDVVVQHIPGANLAIKEMVRILKRGGILILSANNTLNVHSLVKILQGKSYEYGYEKSYMRRELSDSVSLAGLEVVTLDGFYPAYGIYRLKYISPIFKYAGRILNRLNKIVDRYTNRFLSRHFGFEIFVVATKK